MKQPVQCVRCAATFVGAEIDLHTRPVWIPRRGVICNECRHEVIRARVWV
jgi:hypothetical protein